MMKNKKLVSAILAAASIAGGVVGAQATDPATLEAKVDSYTSRVQQAETKISNLETKVNAIDTTGIADNKTQIEANKTAIATNASAIATEKTDREAAVTGLQTQVTQNKNDIATNASAIATEKTDREAAVNGLQTQVTQNKNDIAANASAIATEKTDREAAVNGLQTQVTANKNDIADLQSKIVSSGMAFNADQVDQIAKNKNDIGTIFGQLDQGEYNTQDGYAIKKDDTIGGALKKLDKNAETQGAQISQIQQDMAQDAMDRADEMNKITTKLNEKADKADVEQNKNDIISNAAAIAKETQKREEAVKGLQNKLTVVNGQIENEKTIRENADKTLQTNIDNEAKARDEADKTLQTNINNEATARAEADKTLQTNIDNETAARIAGDNMLNSRINQVETDANKGIAKASALAALRPLDYDPDNKFDISAAGGFYKGENAFALGAFYRPNRNVMLSMGTTLTSGDNAYNVGLTFKIGKSGKHTEAGLTTADLYAMIGAMQDKMDQQQKKIEELEAKQAK